MGATIEQFRSAGIRFELLSGDQLKVVGAMSDDLRAAVRVAKAQIVAEIRAGSDDRRACEHCRNLSDEAQCRAAWRGEWLGFAAPRFYHPVPTLPQQCGGYRPFPDDPDQRPGHERWPSLRGGKS